MKYIQNNALSIKFIFREMVSHKIYSILDMCPNDLDHKRVLPVPNTIRSWKAAPQKPWIQGKFLQTVWA
jgi:hypothetical protein